MKARFSIFLTLLALLLTSCGSSRQPGRSVVQYAEKYMGVPYRYGGTSPKGFDCSGYTQYVFKEFGYKLPRSAAEQSKVGKSVSKKKLQPGDLVFFKGTNARSRKTGHVGIVVDTDGRGNFRFIHASTTRGVRIDHISQRYYKDRYLSARRVLK